jgi:uncharacterized protein with von Willebrand factor type A (vWA) domain
MDLFDRHVDFVGALRRAGVLVSVAEDIDAANALAVIEMQDRAQLRAAYAAAMVKRPAHRPAFDTVFDLYFPATVTDAQDAADEAEQRVEPGRTVYPREPALVQFREQLLEQLLDGDADGLARLARVGVGRFGAVSGGAPGVQSWSTYMTMSRTSPQTLLAALLERSLQPNERNTLAERLMRQTFAARIAEYRQFVDTDVQRRLAAENGAERTARTAVRPSADRLDLLHATDADLTAIRREIQPLARRLAARLTFDHRHGHRGKLDFRRTIRASLSSGGVPMQTHMRPKRPRKTDLVILCDVSDSVTSFARFTLMLVYALREQFTRVRVFAFIDDLDEVTRFFRPGVDVVDAVARLDAEAKVRGWYGRTDYGRAFRLFEEHHADAIAARTSLLILGDARSNYGDCGASVLQQLAGRARRSYWLNPERRGAWDTGDSCASEVGAIVTMIECRNLAQLGDFVRDVV